jgi:hypothetical protein
MEEQQDIIKVKKIKHPDLTNYYISKDGEIFNSKFAPVKSYLVNGYYFVQIKKKKYAVHRMVALTYIKNTNNHLVVNHIDENKTNNKVENLEWVTQKENCNSHTKPISHERKVIQKDLEGNVIKIHNSVTEAGISIGLSRHAVNKVCIGKNQTAGGFKWEYENQEHKHNLDVDLTNAVQIPDYKNYYVFPNGTIYNSQRKSFMKDCINAHGSHYITLSSAEGKKNKYVHNLVATYFIANPTGKTNVRHIDGNKDNNDVTNLEWY